MSEVDTSAEAHDWAALRRLAEAATPGPWRAEDGYRSPDVLDAHGLVVAATITSDMRWRDDSANGAYIAAAHPAAVLALLDQRDAARAQAERWDTEAAASRATIMRLEAERDAARAEAERLREALERLCRNQHAPGSLADAFWTAREALAGMEPGHD